MLALNNQLQGLALANPPLSNRPRFDPRMSLKIQLSGNVPGNPLSAENLKEFLGEYHFDSRGITSTTAEVKTFNPEADNNYIFSVYRQLVELLMNVAASKTIYDVRIGSEIERIKYLHEALAKTLADLQIPQFGHKICTHVDLTPTVAAAIEKCGLGGPLNSEELRNLLRGVLKLWIYESVGQVEGRLFCRVVQGEQFAAQQETPERIADIAGLLTLRAVIKQFIRLRSLFLTSRKNEKHDHDFILDRLEKAVNNLREENGYDI